MEFRTRHMAIFLYAGLASVILVKDLINTPEMALALIAPLIGMFTWDKISNSRAK